MADYELKISCSNCFFVAKYVIDRSTPHAEATLECPNCGCRPNYGSYEVVAFDGNGSYKKKDEDGK